MINCDFKSENGIQISGDAEEICEDFVNIVVGVAYTFLENLDPMSSVSLMMDLFNFGMQQFINPDEDDEDEEEIYSDVVDDVSH